MSELKYEIKNAIIESAEITLSDHGILTLWLGLNYGGLHQQFGGHSLYLPEDWKHYKKETIAGHHIYNIMKVADVTNWKNLVGKSIRVRCNWTSIDGIGHIINDVWFYPDRKEEV